MNYKNRSYWLLTASPFYIGLHLLFITKRSFWFDESFTSFLIKYDFSEVIYRTSLDVHPPLYYLTLKAWSLIFGFSDLALRSMSLLFMTTAILLSYMLVKKMFNRSAALAASVFTAIGPYTIAYAQETRMYSMNACFVLASSIALVHQLQRQKSDRSKYVWVLYTLLITAIAYTHYFGVLVVIAHFIYLLFSETSLKEAAKKPLKVFESVDKNWFGAVVGAGLLFLPWLPTFYKQATSVNSGFWIDSVDRWTFIDTLSQMMSFSDIHKGISLVSLASWLGLGFVLFQFGKLLIMSDRNTKRNSIMLFGPLFFSAIVLFCISVLPSTSSLYLDRYFAQFAPMFYAGLGLLIYKLYRSSNKMVFGLTTLIIVLAMSSNLLNLHSKEESGFRAKTGITELNRVVDSSDVVVVDSYWRYYDTAHYLKDSIQPKITDKGAFFGGESLVKDRSEILLQNYDDIIYESGVIWYISGSDESFEGLPGSWQRHKTLFFENDFRVTKFVLSRT